MAAQDAFNTELAAELRRRVEADPDTSQRGIADESGIPLVTLSRRFNGHSPFRIDEAVAICTLLGTTFGEVVAIVEARIAEQAVPPAKVAA